MRLMMMVRRRQILVAPVPRNTAERSHIKGVEDQRNSYANHIIARLLNNNLACAAEHQPHKRIGKADKHNTADDCNRNGGKHDLTGGAAHPRMVAAPLILRNDNRAACGNRIENGKDHHIERTYKADCGRPIPDSTH